jgi:hypothetical protein
MAHTEMCYFGQGEDRFGASAWWSAMSKKPKFPTPTQDKALNLIFAAMGEGRINRTQAEYRKIAAKLPSLKELEYIVNQFLEHMNKCNGCNGVFLPELCRFKAGDERIVYEPYPEKISCETIRAALAAAGMRQPKWRRSNRLLSGTFHNEKRSDETHQSTTDPDVRL